MLARPMVFTVHVTFGTLRGTRPSTSRSNSSTISGRRCFHHASAVVTLRAVLQGEDFRKIGIGIRRRLVVVRLVGRTRVAARTGPQLADPELRHHVLMVFSGGPVLRRRRRSLLSAQHANVGCGTEQSQDSNPRESGDFASQSSVRVEWYHEHEGPRTSSRSVRCDFAGRSKSAPGRSKWADGRWNGCDGG